MKTDELRQKYLDFFSGKGHTVCPSDVLVPKWDETVLFTPAGMNQFKDHFLGNVELEFTRATTCQKCLRTGDIDNVGRTAYHHTFFEMLGNFSFGDYFKREAIHWAWQFLTDKKWLGIEKSRLTATIYLDDEASAEIWLKDIGLSKDRLFREDEDENYWPAEAPSKGPDGVCGPCSEIYYTADNGEKVEIWNLVFTQFNRCGAPPDNLAPLPSQNIDTGMGLERCAAVLQNVETNYHIDSLRPLVEAAGEVCGLKYEPESDNGRKLRRIADHVRACTFSIHENTVPGPKAENSVIRTLARRAFLDGYQIGMRESFLFQLVPKVTELMESAYPELQKTRGQVQATLKAEEDGFLNTVESGIARVAPFIEKQKAAGSKVFSGQTLFEMRTTYGIPVELTEKLAIDAGLIPDRAEFDLLFKSFTDRSRGKEVGVMGGGPLDEIKSEVKSTEFVGYDTTEHACVVKGVLANGTRQKRISSAEVEASAEDKSVIVLDVSPYYAEAGGQVGDRGIIQSDRFQFEVLDTQKDGDVIKHIGRLTSGFLSEGEQATAQVDVNRREGIRRAHSATHIIHYALQKHVSEAANQQGSKVEDDFLRFDYSNPNPVAPETIAQIEETANECVAAGETIEAAIISLAEARSAGAMMLFGEKYPDPCRMVSMGGFSKELCGGTHLENTADVGLVEIKSESGLAAGTRRIEVFTGEKARQQRERITAQAKQCADLLDCSLGQIPSATQNLFEHVKKLKKQLGAGKPGVPALELDDRKSDVGMSYVEMRNKLYEAARVSNSELFDTAMRIENAIMEIKTLETQLSKLTSSGGVSAESLIEQAIEKKGTKVIAAELAGGNSNLLRTTIDQIRKKTAPVAVLLATVVDDSKVLLVAGISKELVERGYSAGSWIQVVAPVVGGGGGGKPEMAQAGGKEPAKIAEALDVARAVFGEPGG
jgi:alanyl-tRNA synthetase